MYKLVIDKLLFFIISCLFAILKWKQSRRLIKINKTAVSINILARRKKQKSVISLTLSLGGTGHFSDKVYIKFLKRTEERKFKKWISFKNANLIA